MYYVQKDMQGLNRMLYAFCYGFLMALGLIMPLGLQNIFIFNQGAHQRHFLHAMPSVIAAALCDSLLIISAVLGVSVIVLKMTGLKIALLSFGLVFLVYMGFITWFNQPRAMYTGEQPLSARQQIIFSLSVSLLNPHALIDTIGVIGTNSIQFSGYAKFAFTVACVLVSCIWFFVLACIGHFLHKLDERGVWIKRINQFSALVIWTVAASIAWQLSRELF
jgi:L-lysine exporter family protein LysE/ArgO